MKQGTLLRSHYKQASVSVTAGIVWCGGGTATMGVQTDVLGGGCLPSSASSIRHLSGLSELPLEQRLFLLHAGEPFFFFFHLLGEEPFFFSISFFFSLWAFACCMYIRALLSTSIYTWYTASASAINSAQSSNSKFFFFFLRALR